MTVYCQFGHYRTYKEGQLIYVYHNGTLQSRTNGKYLTSLAERNKGSWYLKPIDCSNGDTITLISKVGLKFLGADEERSFTAIFEVSDQFEENEFDFNKVGYGNGFPLLKGKIKLINLLTEKEKRLDQIKSELEESDED